MTTCWACWRAYQALGSDWAKYPRRQLPALRFGYLALRFHLTAIGVGTDLAVLDERYLFAGARFLVYLVSSVPSMLLVGLPWRSSSGGRWASLPRRCAHVSAPGAGIPPRLTWFGIVFAVVMVQFVMRQCFLFTDLLLAPALAAEPAWLVKLLLDDRGLMPLYFSGLVAGALRSFGDAVAAAPLHADAARRRGAAAPCWRCSWRAGPAAADQLRRTDHRQDAAARRLDRSVNRSPPGRGVAGLGGQRRRDLPAAQRRRPTPHPADAAARTNGRDRGAGLRSHHPDAV